MDQKDGVHSHISIFPFPWFWKWNLLSWDRVCSGLDGALPIPPPNMSTSWNLWMWPYMTKRVCIDVMKWRLLRWDHPGLTEWALNLQHKVFLWETRRENAFTKEKSMWRWKQSDVATSQGILEPPEAEWDRRGSPSRTFDFRLLASRTVRK